MKVNTKPFVTDYQTGIYGKGKLSTGKKVGIAAATGWAALWIAGALQTVIQNATYGFGKSGGRKDEPDIWDEDYYKNVPDYYKPYIDQARRREKNPDDPRNNALLAPAPRRGGKKLSTAERKSLPSGDFCGPNRSFPVPDKKHYMAANMMLPNSHYDGAEKAQIKDCLRRKKAQHGWGAMCDRVDSNLKNGMGLNDAVLNSAFEYHGGSLFNPKEYYDDAKDAKQAYDTSKRLKKKYPKITDLAKKFSGEGVSYIEY